MRAVSKLGILLALALAVVAVQPVDSSAQSTIPTAEAQPFLGQWNLPMQGDQPVSFQLDIRDQEGQVAADVSVQGSSSKVSRISKSGENLLLQYDLDIGGQQAPISIRLTPAGSNLTAVLDVAGGMYTANGTATRR